MRKEHSWCAFQSRNKYFSLTYVRNPNYLKVSHVGTDITGAYFIPRPMNRMGRVSPSRFPYQWQCAPRGSDTASQEVGYTRLLRAHFPQQTRIADSASPGEAEPGTEPVRRSTARTFLVSEIALRTADASVSPMTLSATPRLRYSLQFPAFTPLPYAQLICLRRRLTRRRPQRPVRESP